jgi:hypothetical protein
MPQARSPKSAAQLVARALRIAPGSGFIILTRFRHANRWPLRSKTLWLTPGDCEASKASEPLRVTLKICTYRYPLKKRTGGYQMTKSKYPICEHAQRMQDVLLVSSFAIWAMLLGFAPVMTYRLLVS